MALIPSAKRQLSRYITNFSGWRTNRKIIVIESDDWGSIRMPSKKVYNECIKNGYRVDQNPYERFDSLASESDLELLFNILSKFKDKNGNPALITANTLVANPDFKKIKNSAFEEYFYELITDTFKKYPNHSNCFNLWQNGLESKIFYPQSHGREHLNVSMFMKALQEGDEDAIFGFEHKMPGCITKNVPRGENKYVESLRYIDQQDKKEKLSIIIEGLRLFESLFGYRSKTFIPPNYIWSPVYNKSISEEGVLFYQGRRKMKEPSNGSTFNFNRHYLGEKNKFGQKYLVRNAFFEPSLSDSTFDPVDGCLNDIKTCFKMNKPAIICSHRINYVGYLDERNRDKNLIMLERLLKNIISKWPDIEFLNSVELGKEL